MERHHSAHRPVKRAKMIDVGEAIALQQHAQPHGAHAPDLAPAGSGPTNVRRAGPPKAALNGGRQISAGAAGERERQEPAQQREEEELEDGEVAEEGEVPPDASRDAGGSQGAGWQSGGPSSYRCALRRNKHLSCGCMLCAVRRPVLRLVQAHEQGMQALASATFLTREVTVQGRPRASVWRCGCQPHVRIREQARVPAACAAPERRPPL